jgi:cold shock protein
MSDEPAHEVVSYSEFRERRERRLRVADDASRMLSNDVIVDEALPVSSPQSYGIEHARPWWLEGLNETAAAMNGTIKRLVSDQGFGFILADDGNEYFFHNSACANARFDDLREGQAVTFERGHGPKGPRGENVRVVSRNG